MLNKSNVCAKYAHAPLEFKTASLISFAISFRYLIRGCGCAVCGSRTRALTLLGMDGGRCHFGGGAVEGFLENRGKKVTRSLSVAKSVNENTKDFCRKYGVLSIVLTTSLNQLNK